MQTSKVCVPCLLDILAENHTEVSLQFSPMGPWGRAVECLNLGASQEHYEQLLKVCSCGKQGH